MITSLEIKIKPRVSGEIVYLSADEEEQYTIAQANAKTDERGYFVRDRASVRQGKDDYKREPVTKIGSWTYPRNKSWACRRR